MDQGVSLGGLQLFQTFPETLLSVILKCKEDLRGWGGTLGYEVTTLILISFVPSLTLSSPLAWMSIAEFGDLTGRNINMFFQFLNPFLVSSISQSPPTQNQRISWL